MPKCDYCHTEVEHPCQTPAGAYDCPRRLEVAATEEDDWELSIKISESRQKPAERIKELEEALRQCLAYIQFPLRMSRDEDEVARRTRIIDNAERVLGKRG